MLYPEPPMSDGHWVDRLDEAVSALAPRLPAVPSLGLVLGSGLGHFAHSLGERHVIPYQEVPHLPLPRVSGHDAALSWGRVGRWPVLCLQGRVHAYEGYDAAEVTFGVRLLARLGVSTVIVTNAAGGIDPALAPGSFLLITDHLNLTGLNPLCGPNLDALGPRFPDMSRAYDPALAQAARRAAARLGRPLAEGVYAGLLGPSYETPAEIAMLRALGAHAVGMSTVLEVIALRHAGVRVGAMSCITNHAAGVGEAPLSHAEVEATAQRTQADFVQLVSAWVEESAGGEVRA